MFQHDIAEQKFYTSKADGEAAFTSWCEIVGIGTNNFPFTVKTNRFFKGKEVIFRIVTWGSYENQDGHWVVFLNYYAAAPKHTTQYAWNVDEQGKIVGVARQYGFIN